MVLVPLSHPYSFVKKIRVNNIEPLPVFMSERRLGDIIEKLERISGNIKLENTFCGKEIDIDIPVPLSSDNIRLRDYDTCYCYGRLDMLLG